MLLQSHRGSVELLPALPGAWPTGSVTGLRARGSFGVDIAWKDGRLSAASVRSLRGESLTLRHAGKTATVVLAAGRTATWDAATMGWTTR